MLKEAYAEVLLHVEGVPLLPDEGARHAGPPRPPPRARCSRASPAASATAGFFKIGLHHRKAVQSAVRRGL